MARAQEIEQILEIVQSNQADIRSTHVQVMKEASVQGMASEIPALEFEVNSGVHTFTEEAKAVAMVHIKDCAGFASADKQEQVRLFSSSPSLSVTVLLHVP